MMPKKIETVELVIGKVYRSAVCSTYNSLAPILETKQSEDDTGIGFWRCPYCLQWHLYLEPEEHPSKQRQVNTPVTNS